MTTPTPKRRFRFSLRTLLIVVTVIAVFLGMWGGAALRQKRAINSVREAGGSLSIEKPESVPEWLHSLLGDDMLGTVTTVWLRDTTVADVQLFRDIGTFSDLESLSVRNCTLPEGSLAALRGHPSLTHMFLYDSNITDDDLNHCAMIPNLAMLGLAGTQVSDEGIASLITLGKLEYLSLGETRVTDEVINHLARLSALNEIELHKTQVTSEGREELREMLPNCEVDGIRGDGASSREQADLLGP